MTGILITFLAFLAGFLVIFAINLAITDLFTKDRAKQRQRLEEEQLQQNRERVRQALAGRDLDELAAEAQQETSSHKSLLEVFEEIIEQSGMQTSLPKVLVVCALLGGIVGLVLGFLTRNVLVGCMAGIAASALPVFYVNFKRRQRLNQLLAQLPDGLDLMSRILRAGQTISQAMLAVSSEFKGPIATEFGYCYEQQNLGINMDVALRDLASRTGLLEIRIFVLGLLVHRRSGGNLTALLENLAVLIRERRKLRGKIRALTAEGRFQAMALLLLPLIAFGGLFISSREYAMKLFDHPWLLIGSAISMGFGALWIRRIVNFDF